MIAASLKKCALASTVTLAVTLSGCGYNWPSQGAGGFAEHRFGANGSLAHDRFDRGNHNHGNHHRVGSRHYFSTILRKDGYSRRGRTAEARAVHDFAIIAFDERIAYLKARGAERCAPGDLAKAEQLLVRVKRQWVSDLYGDALIDIERLEHRLDVVDNRVFHGHCQRARVVVETPAHKQKEIYKRPAAPSAPLVLK